MKHKMTGNRAAMRRVFSFLLASVLVMSVLAGCGHAEPMTEAPPETAEDLAQDALLAGAGSTAEAAAIGATAGGSEHAAETEPDPNIDYTTGTPWLCSFLDGNVTADTPTPDLKDDFFLAVNKDDLASLQIPEGYSVCGTMYDVDMQADNDIKELFTDAPETDDHDAQLALNLYSLYMDWDTRNEIGVTPLKEGVEEVEAIDSIDALTEYLGRTPFEDQIGALYSVGTMSDLDDSAVHVLYVSQGSVLLDDPAEYRGLTAYGAAIKEARTKLADRMLQKLGYSEEEAAGKIENCLAFETELAEAMMTREEQGRPDYVEKINNRYTRDELEEAQGGLPVLATLEEAMGYPQADVYILFQPEWLAKLNELYTEENLVKIRDSMIVKAAISSAGSLDRECYEWSVECSNAISGSNGMLPDETVFSSQVANALPWPVSRLYTEKYLSQEDKDRISGMIDEIIEEYHGIIEEADFLSDETKEAAAGKLDAMGKGVLWPDEWSAYDSEGLEIDSAEDGGILWDAFKAVSRFAISKDIKEYPEPVDKDRWLYPPTAVNCYYNPQANNIVILGAFARGRLYDPEMSDEELYAKLGTVIGHEISHAFDSTGAQFDKDGNMNQWWTEDDLSAFKERNDKLVAYFDKIHPWEGQDYMASIKSGEACADMGGIKCMLRIAAKKDDFDYDEFFRAYADLWDAKGTLGTTYAYIRDSHPLSYLRVNCTLQQYDEFLDFYGIEEGDGMYLAPEDRVNIW